jgi:hypothetical protein
MQNWNFGWDEESRKLMYNFKIAILQNLRPSGIISIQWGPIGIEGDSRFVIVFQLGFLMKPAELLAEFIVLRNIVWESETSAINRSDESLSLQFPCPWVTVAGGYMSTVAHDNCLSKYVYFRSYCHSIQTCPLAETLGSHWLVRSRETS